mmetsp:Transcript_10268/g.31731  ORF Transcript_10268/g.31731 Transcript_10268/m.31731 type:complete len:256 (+) Transcript_10268:1241-2008(+)
MRRRCGANERCIARGGGARCTRMLGVASPVPAGSAWPDDVSREGDAADVGDAAAPGTLMVVLGSGSTLPDDVFCTTVGARTGARLAFAAPAGPGDVAPPPRLGLPGETEVTRVGRFVASLTGRLSMVRVATSTATVASPIRLGCPSGPTSAMSRIAMTTSVGPPQPEAAKLRTPSVVTSGASEKYLVSHRASVAMQPASSANSMTRSDTVPRCWVASTAMERRATLHVAFAAGRYDDASAPRADSIVRSKTRHKV